jgi:hypothetical protein
MGQTNHDGVAVTRSEPSARPKSQSRFDGWRDEIRTFCADLCAQLTSIDQQIGTLALSGTGAGSDRAPTADRERRPETADVTDERLAFLKRQLAQRIAGCQDEAANRSAPATLPTASASQQELPCDSPRSRNEWKVDG